MALFEKAGLVGADTATHPGLLPLPTFGVAGFINAASVGRAWGREPIVRKLH